MNDYLNAYTGTTWTIEEMQTYIYTKDSEFGYGTTNIHDFQVADMIATQMDGIAEFKSIIVSSGGYYEYDHYRHYTSQEIGEEWEEFLRGNME